MNGTGKKTKIIATIGPASRNPSTIGSLIEAGVNVFRLNFSHGSHEDHGKTIAMVRAASRNRDVPVAILADLQGPKIRTGTTAGDRNVRLAKNSRVTLTSRTVVCDETIVSVDYAGLEQEIGPGQLVMINDGAIRLRVVSVDRRARRVACAVEAGGEYSSRKGVNLPNVALSIPSMTAKDLADLRFILTQDVQYVALSFVRSAADVVSLRRRIQKERPDVRIVAKIEKPEAARNIDAILDVADGIMVARGDLGVEAMPYDVPILQKTLVDRANAAGKVVIVATQMLESMIERPLPTRAEASDVANAIFDGTDAVMLSGETAVGAYPVEAAAMMARIAAAAEQSDYYMNDPRDLYNSRRRPTNAVCEAAVWASRDLGNAPICVFTLSGDTALRLAKIRPQSPIYAFSPATNTVNLLSLAWNVRAFEIPFERNLADLMNDAECVLRKRRLVKKGNHLVVVSGTTPVKGATDIMRIKLVGEP